MESSESEISPVDVSVDDDDYEKIIGRSINLYGDSTSTVTEILAKCFDDQDFRNDSMLCETSSGMSREQSKKIGECLHKHIADFYSRNLMMVSKKSNARKCS